MTYFVSFSCVLGISVGQILFKMSAKSFQESGSYLNMRGAVILLAALVLYGVTTLGWVWVLQKVNLGKVYPIMALAFVLVPMGSYFIFGERFSLQYVIGVAMIMFGIVLTARA